MPDEKDYALWRALLGTLNSPPAESEVSCGYFRLERGRNLLPVAVFRDDKHSENPLVLQIGAKTVREDSEDGQDAILNFEFTEWPKVRAVTDKQFFDACASGRWFDFTPVYGNDDAVPAAVGEVSRSHNQPPEPVAVEPQPVATEAPRVKIPRREDRPRPEVENPDPEKLRTPEDYAALWARYREQIDGFLVLVSALPRKAAAGRTEADQATYAAEKLKAVARAANEARLMQTKPLREERQRIDDYWAGVIDLATKNATELQQKIVDPYARKLVEEKRRAEEEARAKARETGKDEDYRAAREVEKTKVRVGGGSGKATIREREIAVVKDSLALATYLLAMSEPPRDLTEVLHRLAQRMVDAGAHKIGDRPGIPGVSISKDIRR